MHRKLVMCKLCVRDADTLLTFNERNNKMGHRDLVLSSNAPKDGKVKRSLELESRTARALRSRYAPMQGRESC